MSVAELRMGAMSAGWGGQRRLLLERFVHGFELFYPDNDLCTVWARFRADARAAGRAISPQDAWIAATALALDAPLRRTIVGISRTFGIFGCCLCNGQSCLDHPGAGVVRNRLDVIPDFVQINIRSRSL